MKKEKSKKGKMEEVLCQVEPLTRSKFLMKKVGEKMGWPSDVVRELINPQQILILRLPVKFWGKVLVIWGCLVLHNNARGPYKGGVRIAPDVDIWETMELSRLMSLKTAVTDIEFGGGKTGIRLEMKKVYEFFGKTKRDREFERVLPLDICEEFAYQIRRYLIDCTYIPAPDMGSGPEEMAFIYNETQDPASVTGKPDGIPGWLPGRRESTGFGCAYACRRFLEDILGLKPEKSTVAIQGFGNVGSHLALYLQEMGIKIVGITDLWGGVQNKKGLDIPRLFNYAKKRGSVKGFTKESLTNENLFSLEVDVLIPAATGHAIDEKVARNIRAKGIVEAANAPITKEGMDVLRTKKIKVIPDIIANAGGVIASMEEYSRSLSAIKIDKEQVFGLIKQKIGQSLEAVYAICKKANISYAEASVHIAMQRIYQAMRKRVHI